MDFIRDAGWGIWPVLGFGGWALVVAIRHAVAPRDGGMRTLVLLLALTGVAGVFGTVLGVQLSAEHIGEVDPDKRWIFLLGLRESLNNLVAALALGAASLVAVLAGHLRTPPSSAGVAAAKRRGVLST
jgi:hypothetical protein